MTRPPIPRSVDEVTAQWMQQALGAGRASEFEPIKEIVLEEIDARAGVMGTVLRCHLTCERAAGGVPETVIVKLPGTNAGNLRMSRRLQMFRREYEYYTLVAPLSPVRSPALLYGDFAGGSNHFVLVLEDLKEMQTVSQLEGAGVEQARRALRTLARLHGTFWNRGDQPPLDGIYDALAARRRATLQLAYLAHLAPTFERFGSLFSPAMRGLAEAYGHRIAAHIGAVAAGPRTLIHGDARLDNILFPETPGEAEAAAARAGQEEVALIDWQVSGLSTPLYDAAYFLGSSVTTAVRRRVERAALAEYTEIIRNMGVEGFTFDQCWRLYRESTLGRLLAAVLVCGGLDLGDDRGLQMAEVGLQRTLAAIEDLDAGEFLPAPAPRFSRGGAFAAFSRGAYGLVRRLRRPSS